MRVHNNPHGSALNPKSLNRKAGKTLEFYTLVEQLHMESSSRMAAAIELPVRSWCLRCGIPGLVIDLSWLLFNVLVLIPVPFAGSILIRLDLICSASLLLLLLVLLLQPLWLPTAFVWLILVGFPDS